MDELDPKLPWVTWLAYDAADEDVKALITNGELFSLEPSQEVPLQG